MERALLFPGQGSQFVGMAAEFMTHPVTKDVFEEANDALGIDIAKIMREGPAEDLTQTQYTQPALVIHSYAAWMYLQKQSGKKMEDFCTHLAGHSVGEYAAACIGGALSFADTLKLVKLRGEAMAAAVPAGQGAMAAIIGLHFADVDSTARTTGCHIANVNAPLQYIISGSIYTIDEASNILVMQDAKMVKRLDVSGPFHTPYMDSAKQQVEELLQDITVHVPKRPLVMNVDGKETTDPDTIRTNITAQITQAVQWVGTMETLHNNGVDECLELGAGKVLQGLAKRQDNPIPTQSMSTPEEIDAYLDSTVA